MRNLGLALVLGVGVLLSGQWGEAQANGSAAAVQAGQPAAAKKQFFVQLIPPRPTFADDITTAEMKVMQEHAVYWEAEFAKGTVLVIGPVMAGKGVFGMAVLETATEDEARALVMNDPSVKAGLNKFELSPMRVFLMKK